MFVIVTAGLVFVVSRRQQQQQHARQLTIGEGQLRHLRSGDYPASCSWCKSTTLARKLLVFARTPEGWESADLMTRLARCNDGEVPTLASTLQGDHATWRRLCGEACVSQFFTHERTPLREPFVACSYCSTRAPATLLRCPNCGAARA